MADPKNEAGDAMGDAMRDAGERTRAAFEAASDPEAFGRAQAAMGMDPAKMQENFRAATERSLEQSREAYRRMKAAADEANRSLETTVETAHNGSLTLSRKALEAMRTNAELGFEHLEKLATARSMAELIELQTGFVRRQMEAVADQAKEMQSLSRDLAQDMMKPGREAAERMTREAQDRS